MWTNALDFLKRHWLAVVVWVTSTVATVALTLFGAMLTREDTATKVRLEDYQAISSTQEQFGTLLDSFTADLATTGRPDEKLVADLSLNISTLYSKVGSFSPNLGAEGVETLDAYKSSLADLKTGLVSVKELDDMKFFGVDIARFYEKEADLTPVLAKAAGKTAANGS